MSELDGDSLAELACERALEALLFGSPIDAMDDAQVRAWLDGCGVTRPSDRQTLSAQLRGRLPLYRELVRERLSDALAEMLPRTRELLRARWDDLLQVFYTQQGPVSPILRELLGEFVAWARDHFPSDSALPEWLLDGLTFEALQIEVAARGAVPSPTPLTEVDPQSTWVCHPNPVIEAFDFEVQRGAPSLDAPPARKSTHLLGYCDMGYDLHWLELSPLGASLWKAFSQPTTLGAAIAHAMAESHDGISAESVESLSTLLAEWHDRGLLRLCMAQASDVRNNEVLTLQPQNKRPL